MIKILKIFCSIGGVLTILWFNFTLFAVDQEIYLDSVERDSNTSESIPPVLSLVWQKNLGQNVVATPLLVNGKLYAATEQGSLNIIDGRTGQTINTIILPGGVRAAPVYYNGFVYIGTMNNNIVYVDTDTLQMRTLVNTGGTILSSPIIVGNKIIIGVGADNSGIHCYDRESGALQWIFRTRQPVYSSPSYANGVIYCGENAGRIYAIDVNTGEEIWRHQTGGEVFYVTPSTDGNYVFFAPGSATRPGEHHLYILNALTGEKVYFYNFRESFNTFSSAAVDTNSIVLNNVVISYSGGEIYQRGRVNCLSKTGALLWQSTAENFRAPQYGYVPSPTISGGNVFFHNKQKIADICAIRWCATWI